MVSKMARSTRGQSWRTIASSSLDDEPVIDEEVHPARPDHADLCPHAPPVAPDPQPHQGFQAAVGVGPREGDEVAPLGPEPVTESAQPDRIDESEPPGGLQSDEERLRPSAAVDLPEHEGHPRLLEGTARPRGIPVRHAVAVLVRILMTVVVHPDVQSRLVENPDPEVPGGGLTAEDPAVSGGGHDLHARSGGRVDPAPHPDEGTVAHLTLDLPSSVPGAERGIRPHLRPSPRAHPAIIRAAAASPPGLDLRVRPLWTIRLTAPSVQDSRPVHGFGDRRGRAAALERVPACRAVHPKLCPGGGGGDGRARRPKGVRVSRSGRRRSPRSPAPTGS